MAVNPCAPNASQPKAGSQGVASLSAVAISDLLLAGRAAWAFDLAVALGIISFDMTPFCAAAPPDLPDIPATRYLGYFNPLNPQGAAQLEADMRALVGHFFWYASCECAAGPQPPTPAPMPPPPGVTRDPPALSTPTGIPCGPDATVFESKNFDASGQIAWDFQAFPTIGLNTRWIQFLQYGGYPAEPRVYPAHHTLTFVVGATGTPTGRFDWTQTAELPNTTTQTISAPVPTGTTALRFGTQADGANGLGFAMNLFLHQFCSPPPAALDEPCCPPDPLLVQMLTQIMRELDELLARGTGSTGYARGAAHAGLADTGSLPLSRAAGVLIEVTAGVPTNPILGGNPPYMWDLGFITMLTGDGMILERRLTRSAQLWIDPVWALATRVGWFLHPGVRITLTELVSAALP